MADICFVCVLSPYRYHPVCSPSTVKLNFFRHSASTIHVQLGSLILFKMTGRDTQTRARTGMFFFFLNWFLKLQYSVFPFRQLSICGSFPYCFPPFETTQAR